MASVVLTWSANPASDNVADYEVWGANGTATAFGSCTKLATVGGLTWTDIGLSNNQARTYYIRAVNVVGPSSPEGPINITTAAASSTYVQNAGGAPSLQEGIHASRPSAGTTGRLYLETDTFSLFRDNGSAWDSIGGGVVSFNTRTGAVTLTSGDVTGALGFTPLSGNQTITLSGDVSGSGSTAITVTIGAGAVSLSKMANFAANSILGNNTGSPATPLALSGTQVTAMLDAFTSSLKGLSPASGGGTTNFLRADGTWAAPPGSGGTGVTIGQTIALSRGTISP